MQISRNGLDAWSSRSPRAYQRHTAWMTNKGVVDRLTEFRLWRCQRRIRLGVRGTCCCVETEIPGQWLIRRKREGNLGCRMRSNPELSWHAAGMRTQGKPHRSSDSRITRQGKANKAAAAQFSLRVRLNMIGLVSAQHVLNAPDRLAPGPPPVSQALRPPERAVGGRILTELWDCPPIIGSQQESPFPFEPERALLFVLFQVIPTDLHGPPTHRNAQDFCHHFPPFAAPLFETLCSTSGH
ncbi:hypothetical protein B0H67DRAFT_3535 [Lasiosphaeris hirsuta]|uniref:Uncharacterized protein n=1 Tax=Lasiosphaeris hirsuta TaxID=260670 RepID=A0AA40B8N8_9PEZI|nr:hypothetical protein B0H67DRAFT_3535 [Lasiosphaeris hirsuta]